MKPDFILKKLSFILYLLGVGNYWYEDIYKENVAYKIYSCIIFIIMDVVTYSEMLVAFYIKGFPEKFINETKTLTFVHFGGLVKRYYFKKVQFLNKSINVNLLNACLAHEDDKLYKEQFIRIMCNILTYILSIYTGMILLIIYRFYKFVTEGKYFMIIYIYLGSDIKVLKKDLKCIKI